MKIVPLTQGKFATVDDEDFERVMQLKWRLDSKGYAFRAQQINGKIVRISMHRFIINAPEGIFVDHKDGDRLNNTKSNLRLCDLPQNAKNRSPNKNKGFKGVNFKDGGWEAVIKADGKRIYIGYFNNEIAAANAYNHYAKDHHGEFARLNAVEEMANWEEYRYKGTSRYKGVFWNSNQNRWCSYVRVNRKKIYVGSYKTEIEAVIAYNKKALEFGLPLNEIVEEAMA